MNLKLSRSRIGAFTLIEILVVIGIIGILAAVLSANFNDARIDARNKAVRTSLSEVQLALEVYKAQNDEYPEDLSLLVPDYIASLPQSSISANSECDIYNSHDGGDPGSAYYKLTAYRCFAGATSDANGIQRDDEFARCPGSCSSCGGDTFDDDYRESDIFYESMAVYSNGGQCE
jgi:prepilin-type N-terminal cleavage/methylation domain-containing protein